MSLWAAGRATGLCTFYTQNIGFCGLLLNPLFRCGGPAGKFRLTARAVRPSSAEDAGPGVAISPPQMSPPSTPPQGPHKFPHQGPHTEVPPNAKCSSHQGPRPPPTPPPRPPPRPRPSPLPRNQLRPQLRRTSWGLRPPVSISISIQCGSTSHTTCQISSFRNRNKLGVQSLA
jgi:hypothetical protein